MPKRTVESVKINFIPFPSVNGGLGCVLKLHDAIPSDQQVSDTAQFDRCCQTRIHFDGCLNHEQVISISLML